MTLSWPWKKEHEQVRHYLAGQLPCCSASCKNMPVLLPCAQHKGKGVDFDSCSPPACGKQCVLSPRTFRCTPPTSKAENEGPKKADEVEREENRSLEEQQACGGSERLEEKKRARSSVGWRRVRAMSACRPSTAPARTQSGQSEVTQQRPGIWPHAHHSSIETWF